MLSIYILYHAISKNTENSASVREKEVDTVEFLFIFHDNKQEGI